MQYRFYLDGNLLQDEPDGWQDFVTAIKEDDEFRGIFLAQAATLTFAGDGKDYLKSKFDADDVCALIELVVEYECSGNFEEMLRGNIFVTSLSLEGSTISTKIHDDSFFAKIYNNKSIRAYADVTRSKTGTTITAASQKSLKLFDPCVTASCSNLADRRPCYKIFDCFKYIIDFMTDGEVNFVSDAFDVGGQWEGHILTTGLFLRSPAYNTDKKAIPFFSFQEIFIEINKKYNIGMAIEHSGNTPVLRIEPYSYFFDTATSITLPEPLKVKISTDISKLYAKVEIGSEDLVDFDDCTTGNQASFPENVDYVTFKREEFPLLTKCNDDKTLNLVSSWVISSNAIQDTAIGNNDSFDDKIFLIEATRDDATNHSAIPTDIFSDGSCFYNAFYLNQNVLLRWNDSLPYEVQVILGNSDNLFDAFRDIPSSEITLTSGSPTYASATTDGFGNALEIFQDDYLAGNDGGVSLGGPNNYGTTVNPVVQVTQGNPVGATESIYIIPNNGNYAFVSYLQLKNVRVNISIIPVVFLDTHVIISHYDSAGALINSYDSNPSLIAVGSNPIIITAFSDTGIINATAGDYLSVKYSITANFLLGTHTVKFNIDGGVDGNNSQVQTLFRCYFSQGHGGTLTQNLNNDFQNLLFEFEYPMTFAHYKALKADTKKKIAFDYCGQNYTANIRDIQYAHHDNSKLILKMSKNGYRNNP